jgi:hypothetical protein
MRLPGAREDSYEAKSITIAHESRVEAKKNHKKNESTPGLEPGRAEPN